MSHLGVTEEKASDTHTASWSSLGGIPGGSETILIAVFTTQVNLNALKRQ